MNKKILKTLEYDAVKTQIKPFLSTVAGEKELRDLLPTSNAQKMQQWLAETADASRVLRWQGGISIPKLADVKPHMQRLRIHAALSGTELAQVGRVLFTTGQIRSFFENLVADRGEALPALAVYYNELVILPELTRRVNVAIDGDGRLNDEASAELHRIRQAITGTENAIRQKMQDYTRGKTAQYLSDPIVTIRNDRYVLPVKATYRQKFGGVVHDQSQTGQTLYIEPADVVDMNNRLREYTLKERREEERVLIELSAQLEPEADSIENNAQLLGHLDFLNAKARYAVVIKAIEPEFSPENHVRLLKARHPLLNPDKVVPNDIIIGEDYSAIIVTGPNTGGKTITLKTLGLLQIMAQSGLFIPAAEYSSVGIFKEIFADIGDEQSIEQSLSTFSAHMVNIIDILSGTDKDSLVLFDELGAGTDPQEGAALAMAILDAVGETGAYSVATTHYPELKVYGYNRADTINASMEFDIDSLRPTYKFLIGVPGRSNALEIAKKLGLDKNIIDSASALTTEDSQELNDMIADLVARRNAVLTQQVELTKKVIENRQLKNDYESKLESIDKERAKAVEEAKKEANHIVADARRKTDKIIADLHKMARDGAAIKENKLIDAKGALNAMHQEPSATNNRILRKAKQAKQVPLLVGDTVLVREYGQQGTIVRKLKDHKFEVQMGILKMVLTSEEIEKQTNQSTNEPKSTKKKRRNSSSVNTNKAINRAEASAKLDLRGVRYEPAMAELDRFIDKALLNNLSSVEIIHGKGTGAIRQGVQEYLRSHRQVQSFKFTGPDQGATYVQFS
ncbi:endonuclease MutS2 [Weissella paramesenteroides]|jgi:DNA mismatch repair protein MutS2|uniref:endonuclease MutS2 n=1 Tax=Weissella paramesenteroides TaxID=1249 RepID=UPI0013DB76C2|nr:endonuclease MutS2 [Weissella paramesenteroides]MCS9984225.1 endonuclease MutS2 [Weissella paramesenteroides]MCS9998211.1 endonuclease MutS2 [Weissella paramesenteroides]MCT0260744.1 endonuclease MutS2 [Weissella paramesenteroides]MCT0484931.1 endonuclease MutS2 [Weissella paramesenteroides]MDF8367895.1 endonuclease MutS2 [Weissella paramesenteroides]